VESVHEAARRFCPIPGTALAHAVATKRASQTIDVAKHQPYQANPRLRSFAALTGARTLIAVRLLKENEVIGAIIIYRKQVRSFTDKQVEPLNALRRSGRDRHREHAAT
jgi:hypothetical protein